MEHNERTQTGYDKPVRKLKRCGGDRHHLSRRHPAAASTTKNTGRLDRISSVRSLRSLRFKSVKTSRCPELVSLASGILGIKSVSERKPYSTSCFRRVQAPFNRSGIRLR